MVTQYLPVVCTAGDTRVVCSFPSPVDWAFAVASTNTYSAHGQMCRNSDIFVTSNVVRVFKPDGSAVLRIEADEMICPTGLAVGCLRAQGSAASVRELFVADALQSKIFVFAPGFVPAGNHTIGPRLARSVNY